MAASVNGVETESAYEGKLQSPNNVAKNILDIFWKLAETKKDARLSASVSMVRALAQKQEAFDAAGESGEKCPELQYALERLVRGLSSSRQAARQGYALVLTEVLRLFPVVSVEDVLQQIEKHLPVSVKQDKCHMVIGQLIAYSSLVRSNCLQDSSHLSLAVMNLYRLSNTRSYLQKAAYQLMVSLFSQMNSEHFKEVLWPHLRSELKCGWENGTPHVVAWLMLTVRMFPQAVGTKFLAKHWGSEDLLAEENFCHWKKVIKQSTIVHPEVHPVCLEFLEALSKNKLFKDIWSSVIDENLFETDQNEKTFLGFHLVKEVLPKLSKKKLVKAVICPGFSAAFSRSYMYAKHPLNSAACKLASFFCQYVKDSSDPVVQILILKLFLQPPGTLLLQQVLKKKEVVLIISYLCPEALKSFFILLKSVIFHEDEEKDSDVETEGHKRHLAAVQIGTLVSHPVILSDVEWRLSVLKFLLLHSYFTVIQTSEDIPEAEAATESFPASLRETFANSFVKALDSVTRKADAAAVDILQSITDYAEHLLSAKDFVAPVFDLQEVQESWHKMKKLAKKLKKFTEKDKKRNECHAFLVLVLHLGLQLFQDVEYIGNLLKDLEVCCKKCLNLKAPQEEEASEHEDGPPWIQVLVDILLSVLSQKSHHMRRIVCLVFPLFCPFITASALQLVFDVIDPQENAEPTLEEESDDDEEDVEFKSGSSSSNEEEEDDDVEGRAENCDDGIDEEFRTKIQKALGPAADVSDAEDSDAVLTDSEMFKLDDALAKAFQSQKKTSSSQLTEEQKTLLDFKMRCLDLIMLYLKAEPPMSLVLKCIKPVLGACDFGNQQKKHLSLAEKAVSAMKLISRVRKFQHIEDVNVDDLEDTFRYLSSRIHRETRPVVSSVLFSLCVFLVLCERKLKAKTEEEQSSTDLKCVQMYLTTLEEFVNQSNSHVQPQMFLGLIHSCPECAWSFVKPLEKFAFSESVRLYRKSQCLGLIVAAIKLSKAQKGVTQEMWTDFAERLVPKAVEALKTVMSGTDVKPLYTTELLDVLLTTDTVLREKTNKSLVRSHHELLDLLTSVSNVQCKKLPKKGHQLWKRLVTLLGGKLPPKAENANSKEHAEINDSAGRLSAEDNSSKQFKKKRKGKVAIEQSVDSEPEQCERPKKRRRKSQLQESKDELSEGLAEGQDEETEDVGELQVVPQCDHNGDLSDDSSGAEDSGESD